MASRLELSESEVLSELACVGSAPENAMTMHEIADATGFSIGKVRNDLWKLQRTGRLIVHRVVRRKIDGHSQIVPAYTLMPARGKK